MTVEIIPPKNGLCGSVEAIPSKSEVHRLICSAILSDCSTKMSCGALSDDIRSTLNCAAALGCAIETSDSSIKVTPPVSFREHPLLECGECGSTARFMLPIAAVLCDSFTLDGAEGLRRRPMKELCSVMRASGCDISSDRLPIKCSGRLSPGNYSIRGDVSSQYITGLLLALSRFEDRESTLKVTGNFESRGYVELTLETLARFGINVGQEISDSGTLFTIDSRGYRSPGKVSAGGDWSNMAAWFCAAAINGFVTVNGLDILSKQKDRLAMKLLDDFGALTGRDGDGVSVRSERLHGIAIDARDVPDLVPVIAAVASLAEGQTIITGASRLRLKESDRIASTRDTLTALGADICATDDGFVINGKKRLSGGRVSGLNDHRIVMCAAVAASGCENPVIIDGAETVAKSYPSFFDDYNRLGGSAHVI